MRVTVLLLLVVLWPCLTLAETRVALVLGAERYAALRPLANPLNDARAVEETLLALGFDVTLETNRDLRRMRRALEDFVYDHAGADVALIYFAGHGMEVAGQNLLLPVDAPAGDVTALVQGGLPLDEVAATLQQVGQAGLLIVDACRNDPFGTGGTEGAGRGAISLATSPEITPGLSRIGRADNLLYAFSAAPGQAASDGQGDKSPFTAALTRHLATPGLEIRQVLTLVQQDVYDRTRGAQLPYVESGLPALVFAGGVAALPEREQLLLSMAGMQPAHRALIERVAAQNDMPLAPLFGAFLSANLASRTVEDQTAELTASAEAFTALRRDMAQLSSDDPRVSALRMEADEQLELGAFTLARAKLSEAAEIDRTSRETLRDNYIARTLSEAETHYLNARAAEADLRRDLAIADYERAVMLFEEVYTTGKAVPRSYLRALDSLVTAHRFQGETQKALNVARIQSALTETQLDLDPQNTDWMRDHAVSLGKLGALAMTSGDSAVALAHFRDALKLTARLTDIDPDRTQWQRDLAVSYTNIGQAAQETGNLAAAKEGYQRGMEIMTQLLRGEPDNVAWRKDLGISHERLGIVALAQGDIDLARHHHEKDLEITQSLVSDLPDDPALLRGLALAHSKLGDVARAAEEYPAAQRSYQEAQTMSERLVSKDPGNTQWQRDLSIAHGNLGKIALEFGFTALARDHFERDFEITENLALRDPQNAEWQRDLAISHDRIGAIAHSEQSYDAARRAYRAALSIREELAAQDPDRVLYQRDLTVSHSRLGDVAREAGDMETARAHYARDLDITARLAASDTENTGWQLDLVLTHVRMFQSEADPLLHLDAALAVLRKLDEKGRLPEPNQPWIAFLETARQEITAQE